MFRQRTIYILKHNAIAQKMYRVIFNLAFSIIGLFVKFEPNLVMFISLMGSRYNDSPRSMYEYIKNHKEYAQYKCVWAFENPEAYPDIPSVRIDTPQFFLMLLKAGFWVSNTNIQRGLSFKKKRTRWVYTCHGTAIKLCGNDCPGRKDFDYSRVNTICVQSKYDEMVLKRGFKAREESFLECGRPCSDELFHATDSNRGQMRNRLNIPEGKTVILYAPTWRDSADGGVSYTIKPPIDFKRWELELGDDYIVLFRAHHITTKILNIAFNDFVRDVSSYPEVNDLLMASDILISDYSAILTDYAILERPVLCFAYDYEEYLKERGTYFDLEEEMPNKPCRTEDELLYRIKHLDFIQESVNTGVFRRKFIEFGGNATEQAVKALFQK